MVGIEKGDTQSWCCNDWACNRDLNPCQRSRKDRQQQAPSQCTHPIILLKMRVDMQSCAVPCELPPSPAMGLLALGRAR